MYKRENKSQEVNQYKFLHKKKEVILLLLFGIFHRDPIVEIFISENLLNLLSLVQNISATEYKAVPNWIELGVLNPFSPRIYSNRGIKSSDKISYSKALFS